MNLILTLIFIFILLLCIWDGLKRGLILGIGSLLALVISLYAADLLSTTYSYEVIDALRPFASGYMETTINNNVRPEYNITGASAGSLSVEDYLEAHEDEAEGFCQRTFECMGVYPATAAHMAQDSLIYAQSQALPVTDAMVEVLCKTISYVGGFILAFLLILILLTVLGNLTNLSFKIPGADMLNDIGGMVTGLVQGFCFCALIAWVLKFTGVLLPQDSLADHFFISWLMKLDPLYTFLGI